jgi:hypothetical protein
VTINGRKQDVAARTGVEHRLSGDSLIVYLPVEASQPVEIGIAAAAK